MGYCTATDVSGEFKSVSFSSTTSVSDTDVANFIAMADELINSRVSLKYLVPITGAAALLIAKQISLLLVVGRIKNILQVKTGNPAADQGGAGESNIKLAMSMLRMIVEDELLLRDATAAAATGAVASYTSNGGGSDYERAFEVDTVQW